MHLYRKIQKNNVILVVNSDWQAGVYEDGPNLPDCVGEPEEIDESEIWERQNNMVNVKGIEGIEA